MWLPVAASFLLFILMNVLEEDVLVELDYLGDASNLIYIIITALMRSQKCTLLNRTGAR